MNEKAPATSPRLELCGISKRYPGGVLLEQPFFVVDEKQSVKQGLGGADVVQFAQIVVGG